VGEGDPPLVLINPRIVDASDVLETAEEGCLSIPDIYGDVERPAVVTFEAWIAMAARTARRSPISRRAPCNTRSTTSTVSYSLITERR